ncbi:D-2-hydroxyacid dehydrogenase [Tepidibacillus fermentans]|uniref:Phosphoglycerate dehydrogenase-like enzyme n=1 Tax=Tepidibacillus fermentans TaxID=1281767 RepID=A0A4R3KHI2_9BACI|nr:D-2-hydroxyacid dehydrogenase [Tepidibacillus fermentans]TCS82593.1 phosphoglycerate dehydrogenase-like enzyme [Tepidibacillus fermentans]
MKIVFSAKISEKHQITLKEQFPNSDFYFYANIDEAKNEIASAEIFVTYGEDLNDEIVQNMNQLKWIHVVSAGLDKMPFQSLQERKVIVTNSKGIHRVPMSEYTMAVILQLVRKTNQFFEKQKEGLWDRTIRVSEVYGSTIGIIGLGAIGLAIAEKAKIFGMTVIGTNTDGRPIPGIDKVYPSSSLKEVLSKSDYVVVIVPLTDQTYRMIGREELLAMKRSAYLINISRGDVIDEQGLLETLRNREIAGAVLDVFSEEPLPSNHPFWGLDNVIITPHVSGRSPKYMERALEIFKNNFLFYLNQDFSQMKNLVDLQKGY